MKTLNAPGIDDNYYYKTIDYSRQNLLVVALENQVHQFDFENNSTAELYSLSDSLEISSVSCHADLDAMGIATSVGEVLLVDHETRQVMRKLHSSLTHSRVVATKFKDHLFGHGTREGEVLLFDIRCSKREIGRFHSHHHEICSIKFSEFDEGVFATGGNDNNVNLYDLRKMSKIKTLSFHKAAVKALSFSKMKKGEMLTGGGSGDQMLCKWDINKFKLKNHINLRSQICSLEMSSKGFVVTSHGWPKNQIEVRDSKSFKLLAQFTGHTQRVLDISIDKKEEILATSSGDQTIRFWSIKNLKKNIEDILELTTLTQGNQLR